MHHIFSVLNLALLFLLYFNSSLINGLSLRLLFFLAIVAPIPGSRDSSFWAPAQGVDCNCGGSTTRFTWLLFVLESFIPFRCKKYPHCKLKVKFVSGHTIYFLQHIFELIWVFWVHLGAYHSCLVFQAYCRPATLKTTSLMVWFSFFLSSFL